MPAVNPEGKLDIWSTWGENYIEIIPKILQDQKGVGTSHMDKTRKSFWAEGIACTKAQKSPWNSGKVRIPVCSTRSDYQYNGPHCYQTGDREVRGQSDMSSHSV